MPLVRCGASRRIAARKRKARVEQWRRDRRRDGKGGYWVFMPRLLAKVADYRCQLCGEPTPSGQGVADHWVPIVEGGGDDWENGRWLCQPCHKAKTRLDARHGREHGAGWAWLELDEEAMALDGGCSGAAWARSRHHLT